MSRKQRALDASHELTKVIEALNSDLLDFEQTLDELNLGVTSAVPLDAHHSLRFGKDGNVWRLLLEDDQGGASRVLNCSREYRILAAANAGPLFARLIEEAETQANIVRSFSNELRALTVSIRKSK